MSLMDRLCAAAHEDDERPAGGHVAALASVGVGVGMLCAAVIVWWLLGGAW